MEWRNAFVSDCALAPRVGAAANGRVWRRLSTLAERHVIAGWQAAPIAGGGVPVRRSNTLRAAGSIPWRSVAFARQVAHSTGETEARGTGQLWKIFGALRGEPSKLRIAPRDEAAASVDIKSDWHSSVPSDLVAGHDSTPIDIAILADGSVHPSAPAIFTASLPSCRKRGYWNDPRPRLVWFGCGLDKDDPCLDGLFLPRANCANMGTVKGLSHFRLRADGSLGLIREQRGDVHVLAGGPLGSGDVTQAGSTRATARSRCATGCGLSILIPHICLTSRESRLSRRGDPETDQERHAPITARETPRAMMLFASCNRISQVKKKLDPFAILGGRSGPAPEARVRTAETAQ